MTAATTSGLDSITKCEAPSTSVVVEPARPYEKRCRSYAAAVPPLRRALRALAGHDRHTEEGTRWLWFSCSITPEPLAPELWDDEAWHDLATRAVRHARDAGALAIFPLALTYRAGVHVQAGDFDDASALIAEAKAITDATGNAPLKYSSLLLVGWRGRQTEALDVSTQGIEDATARGEGRAIGFAQYVKALVYNGFGRYPEALTAAQAACAHDDLGLFGLALTELVEAAVRCDRRTVALDAMRRLEERTHATGTEWAVGIEARARALLSEDEVAEHLYREAIERLGRTRIRVELVRTQLQYGEWLRRQNRRVDARKQLHGAYDASASMGAEGFAERARRELLPAKVFPTPRSAADCSSALERSNGTCAKCSPSSGSGHA
jgi:tetratricopeptide (TPR) repeat protein